MAQKRSELLKNSDYLSNLTTGLGLNGTTNEIEKTSVSLPEMPLSDNNADKKSKGSQMELQQNLPKESKPQKQVKRIVLEITSDKRRTAGFHIFPEYENAIEAIRMNGHYKNKGMALEMLVNFYLSHIDSDKKDSIMKIMTAPKERDDW